MNSPLSAELWTLVPMRGIDHGKSRLAAAIDESARAHLNRWLLTRTLEVLGRWRGDLRSCTVVSPCDQALELAQRAGARTLREPEAANDLNRALELGAAHAIDQGAGKILILPSDLPDLTVASLNELARAAARRQHMVIAPDKAGTGTNALLVDACADFAFRFGENSCARHRAWASEQGWTISVHSRPDLEFDLDTPDDLALWSRRFAVPIHKKFAGGNR